MDFHREPALRLRDHIVRKCLELGVLKEGETFESIIATMPWDDTEERHPPPSPTPKALTPVREEVVMCSVGCQTDPAETIKDVPKVQKAHINRKKKFDMRTAGNKEVISQNCMCRMWTPQGYDNIQCEKVQVDGEDYCKQHLKKVEKYGQWWCGRIDEPRNEVQMGPPDTKVSGQQHLWHDQRTGKKVKKNKPKSPPPSSSSEEEEDGGLTYRTLPNGVVVVT